MGKNGKAKVNGKRRKPKHRKGRGKFNNPTNIQVGVDAEREVLVLKWDEPTTAIVFTEDTGATLVDGLERKLKELNEMVRAKRAQVNQEGDGS